MRRGSDCSWSSAARPGSTIGRSSRIDQTRRIAEVQASTSTPAQVLGAPESGLTTWKTVRSHALVHLAAEALGGSQKVLEDSVKYAKERVQFGKPIGVNQAIKHKCADMLIQVESSKSITYYAAWAVAENTAEAELAASMAKAYTSDAYRATSAENIQIHGGVGFTWEYDCHLYYKRAKAIEVTYGDPSRAPGARRPASETLTSEPAGVAFLGAGWISRVYLAALQRAGGARLVAVASRTRAAAEKLDARARTARRRSRSTSCPSCSPTPRSASCA